MRTSHLRVFGAAALLAVLGAGRADAGFTVEYLGATPIGLGSDFAHSYQFVFTPEAFGESLTSGSPGNFVTIYDVTGSLVTPGLGYSVSAQLTGLNGAGTSVVDDPTLFNVTFTYTGSPVATTTTFTGFSIVSSVQTPTWTQFSAQTTTQEGAPLGNAGTIGSSSNPVPVPASAVLAGLGAVAGFAGLRRRARAS